MEEAAREIVIFRHCVVAQAAGREESGGVAEELEILGAGLAGCCLAWQLDWRSVPFRLVDTQPGRAASRVAAGLVNPVTGKNFNPSWRLGEFLPESLAFFERVGSELGLKLWRPMLIARLIDDSQWPKVEQKLARPEVARWVERVEEHVDGWRARVVFKGGGRVDTTEFCRASWERFAGTSATNPHIKQVRCCGAYDLLAGRLGKHRCAKGEILTLRLPGGDESCLLIGGGGWLAPLGDGLWKAGASYEWDQLDERPTPEGEDKIRGILATLGVENYEIVAHEAGLRPILRSSMPLIGVRQGKVYFNSLGSKGSLYAPGMARRLCDWLLDGAALDPELDLAFWETGDLG